MSQHPRALPHEPITEAFEDVFFVRGQFPMRPGVRITRTMTIVRDNGELTLFNAIRLSEEGERALTELGKVKQLVKLGHFHTRDDPYYLERFEPTFFALPKTCRDGLKVDVELSESTSILPNARVSVFQNTKFPEAVVFLERDSGIMISCDAIQNFMDLKGCSILGKLVTQFFGFRYPANIGSMWLKFMTKKEGQPLRSDFDRLLENDFQHLLSAHGLPLRDSAKQDLKKTMLRVF